MCPDYVMEFFSVLVELHDALGFFCHPELIEFIRQIACKEERHIFEKFTFYQKMFLFVYTHQATSLNTPVQLLITAYLIG